MAFLPPINRAQLLWACNKLTTASRVCKSAHLRAMDKRASKDALLTFAGERRTLPRNLQRNQTACVAALVEQSKATPMT